MVMQDTEDDVRAVSADALLPVADLLASRDEVDITPLTSALWDALLHVDELSPSTGERSWQVLSDHASKLLCVACNNCCVPLPKILKS